jgi:farnesyl diphosphate synthase
MDDDDLRRGQPTCHIKFGEANAILAGDALQTLAFTILADADMPDVAAARSVWRWYPNWPPPAAPAGMCGGQALDLEAEGQQVRPGSTGTDPPPQNRRADPRRSAPWVRLAAGDTGRAVKRYTAA